MNAAPPPGIIPSAFAAFAALIASSILSFFSIISTSVLPPGIKTATPETNFASLSSSRFFCDSESVVLIRPLSSFCLLKTVSGFPFAPDISVSLIDILTFSAWPRSSSFTSLILSPKSLE